MDLNFSKQFLVAVAAGIAVAAMGTWSVWAWEDTVRPRLVALVKSGFDAEEIDFGETALKKRVGALEEEVGHWKTHDHQGLPPADNQELESTPSEGGSTSMKVKLYMSTIKDESSLIVLNGNSQKIADFVKYGKLYQASVEGELGCKGGCTTDALKAELRNLEAEDASSYEAIGRIPATQYDKLNGRKHRRIDALIELAST